MITNNLLPSSKVLTFQTSKPSGIAQLTHKLTRHSLKPTLMEQVHGNSFKTITQPKNLINNIDALITTTPGIALTVKSADCLPILVFHPRGIIGAIHAGRRGTTTQITAKFLTHLLACYSLSPQNFSFYFGPHICASCYQIDRNKNTHYNLTKQNLSQIKNTLKANYFVSHHPSCTACDPNFYSYRKEGPQINMNYASIALL